MSKREAVPKHSLLPQEQIFTIFTYWGRFTNCPYETPENPTGIFDAILAGFPLHFIEISVDFAAKRWLKAVKTTVTGDVKNSFGFFNIPFLFAFWQTVMRLSLHRAGSP